ncbi:unnamed protein product [Zymoseptoria tritici ST99CH_1E4]|uniref:Survival motor neuron Tudor domain-containing protein n=1 Tax=Zymoseptoria tritici ST99CH_1E4 TaxID=1276532 RepID=A0A2H1H5S4_ZYMTR|nr:unnamed protein product [Zymoseptoria tritici ST99CH_1E4]
MAETSEPPSDWDDSALQTSWNDAYAEYQRYHSLAALGKKVSRSPSVSQEVKATSQAGDLPSKDQAEDAAHVPLNFVKAEGVHPSTPAPARPSQPVAGKFPATPMPGGGMPGAGLRMPKELFSACGATGGQEVHMRNLMMSWYYAGYYTGLLEGQQKAWAAMQEVGGEAEDEGEGEG